MLPGIVTPFRAGKCADPACRPWATPRACRPSCVWMSVRNQTGCVRACAEDDHRRELDRASWRRRIAGYRAFQAARQSSSNLSSMASIRGCSPGAGACLGLEASLLTTLSDRIGSIASNMALKSSDPTIQDQSADIDGGQFRYGLKEVDLAPERFAELFCNGRISRVHEWLNDKVPIPPMGSALLAAMVTPEARARAVATAEHLIASAAAR